jgi:hypothetical protein
MPVLRAEATWVARVVTALPAEVFPMLNVGSQTRRFREIDQPMIERQVFARLRSLDRKVIHTDLREGDGIDVSGDLMDPAFRRAIVEDYGIRSVLCCNVLEHVPDPAGIAAALAQLVEVRHGHLIATVPRAFPYHPDPIDTMFRPSGQDLSRLVAPLMPISITEVRSGTLLTYAAGRLIRGRQSAMQNYRTASSNADGARPPRRALDLLPWAIRRFAVTCGWFRSTTHVDGNPAR